MIDTDKYEGHTLNHPIHMDEPNPHDGGHREMLCDGGIIGWLQMDDYPSADANAMLLADAPLLLEEVKRLREITEYVKSSIDFHYHSIDNDTGAFIDWMEYARELYLMFYGGEEE